MGASWGSGRPRGAAGGWAGGGGRIAAPSAGSVKAGMEGSNTADSRPRRRPAVSSGRLWWLGLGCDRDGEDLVAAAQPVQVRAGLGQVAQPVCEGARGGLQEPTVVGDQRVAGDGLLPVHDRVGRLPRLVGVQLVRVELD